LNQTSYDIPQGTSNLMGAYDEKHWQVVVLELKPNSGVLKRGSVLALVSGKLELVTATNQATAYRILLDLEIDTTVLFADGSITGSIARAGSFRGQALVVAAGTDATALTERLRDIGIFTEGPISVPTAAEAEAPTAA
jgi:hypothetical protein